MSQDPRHPDDRRDPLTPEERALADRLARLGPHGEPSPALDARILDVARAAAVTPPPAATTARPAVPHGRRPRRRRWPVAIGTAATLVVVAGLAWQLRPVDDMHVAYSEALRVVSGPSADAAAAPAGEQRAVAKEVAPVAAAEKPAAPAVPGPDADQAGQADAAPPPAPAPERAPEPVGDAGTPPTPAAFRRLPPPPGEPAVVFDEPSPMDTAAPPPPAPPAPPAPARPVEEPAPPPAAPETAVFTPPEAAPATAADPAAAEEEVQLQRAQMETAPARRAPVPQVATGTAVHPAEPAAASSAAEASELDSVAVTGARADGYGDQPIDDQPPASADSPQVQDAWLRRVRQLMSEGRLDEARESLREYRHRYPGASLPEDLRALLAG